jgi:magnesium transporter
MKKSRHKRKTGMLPGSLVHTGKKKMDSVELALIQYNEKKQSKKVYHHEDNPSLTTDNSCVSWLNVDGLHDVEEIKKIGERYSLHQLLLEDVLSMDQRPKAAHYENCVFLSLKMFHLTEGLTIDQEQVSIVLTENTVISFQERKGDVFDGIRSSIQENTGRIRKKNADFLVYRMLDVIVDNYFLILDFFEDKISVMEENIDSRVAKYDDKDIRILKKQILDFRKDSRPLNDAIQRLLKDDVDKIELTTKTYLNDVHDHLSQIIDGLDVQRENLTYLTDQYHSQQGMKLNKVMKLLTIVSTIFIPLTFIVGVYGMNFKNIPELQWEKGYLMVWGLMLAVTVFMIVLFRYKKWW